MRARLTHSIHAHVSRVGPERCIGAQFRLPGEAALAEATHQAFLAVNPGDHHL